MRSCNPQGLPKPTNHFVAGELLPRLFTLTCLAQGTIIGGINFCSTFCHAEASLPFEKYGALRCPDFPLPLGAMKSHSNFLFNPKEQLPVRVDRRVRQSLLIHFLVGTNSMLSYNSSYP